MRMMFISQVITEGSFDTYMWQTLERKGRFIDQIMRGTLGGARDIEDVSEATLSFAEFKAIEVRDCFRTRDPHG